MKFNISFTEPTEPVEPNVILTEARAKIIWGESASSVRDYLTSKGMSVADADAKIKDFDLERNTEIRKIGIQKIFIGTGLIFGAVIALYFMFRNADSDVSYSSIKSRAVGASGGVLGGFYGLWKLVDGIACLVRPKSEKESITEISE